MGIRAHHHPKKEKGGSGTRKKGGGGEAALGVSVVNLGGKQVSCTYIRRVESQCL